MTSLETLAVPAAGKEDKMETGLHSPPETNMKDTSSDSELSDLEPEPDQSDELEDLQPDHYSPDSTVPVFKPTMDEFRDFQRYMRGIHHFGMRHGIVKVIPPPEWLANQPPLDDIVKTIRIKEPIAQDIMGSNGTYRQANILHGRSYNLPQWRQLCDQSEHQPPAKRGERRANADKPAKAAPKPKTPALSNSNSKKKSARPTKGKGKSVVLESVEGTGTPERLPTPESPAAKPEEKSVRIKKEILGDDECTEKPKGGRQPKAISVSSRRKHSRREGSAAIDEEAFKGFKYELEGVDYSQERCDELERSYWKSLTYAPPLYGADMMGSLFDERTTTWNLGKLENILDVLGSKIPGVNTAYLYLGMWKATFAWHLEDVDLYSINYLHFGAPKQWYSISQGDARRFEAAMKTIWPADAKACDQFLRHKTFLISPSRLMENFNIKVNKIVHRPGEFVITFPYGYHSGYNLGYNCAEAVNFGLDAWLPFGRVAKKCDCSEAQDSVWIDVSAIDRKLRGEETEIEESDEDEEDEEDEEDVDSASINILTPSGSKGTKIKAPQKKRKRPVNEKIHNTSVKKIRVRIKGSAREPCMLCPNDIPSEPLLPTEDGRKAHRICARYIPETSISDGDNATVTDVKYIDKARMELKCNYCRSKKGACFQCSHKKCTRAYHATCAAAAGVFVEEGEIPVFGEDGTEYKDWGIEFSCRFHRVKRDHKKLDGETLDSNERVHKAASLLKVGETCQIQYYRGDIFAGTVVENRKSEEMLLLDILPRGERVEVQHKWLLVPDAADFRLVKPSVNAIPMPKSFKDKESLNTSKRQADDMPRADDIFVEGCTWSEFKSEAIPRNTAQVKIDLSKENQIWYYLGKTSTEAKAQFTENPTIPRHNPKGHFLDTIPKTVPTVARQSYSASYPSAIAQVSTAPKPISRPVVASTSSAAKTEKPYVYKPRVTSYGDSNYSIDPQAYRCQQSFVQQSQSQNMPQYPPQYQSQTARVPYSFGTDPRWQSAETKSPAPYDNQGSASPSWNNMTPTSAYASYSTPATSRPQSTTPIRPPSAPQPPAVQQSPTFATSPQSAAPILPPAPTSIRPPPSASSNSQPTAPVRPSSSSASTHHKSSFAPVRPPPTATPLAAPQNQHRAPILPPGNTPKHAAPSKSNNPFSGRAPSAKPNVFAKYSYLQKEHNRSPLEYRTPYRPGGGFMNGYQGNIQEHWKKALFQDRSTSSTPHSNLPLLYSSRVAYGPNQQPLASYNSGSPPTYNSVYDSRSSQRQPSQETSLQTTNGTPTSWDRKDTTQLHPAIRQDYNNMIPRDHQPSAPRPSQPQYYARVMQPPAMYDRQASQMQGSHKQQPAQPRQTSHQDHQPVHKSLSAAHPQSYNQANARRQPFQPQQQSTTGPPPNTVTEKQQRVPIRPPTGKFKVSQPALQQPPTPPPQRSIPQENRATSAGQQPLGGSLPESSEPQIKTFTDVPSDSTSIIEKLMSNLRKAAASQASGH